MSDSSRGWLILHADLTLDWEALYAYRMRERSAVVRRSRQAGIEAFDAQQAAAHVLLEAAWAEQENVRVIRRAGIRAERHAASIERRRRYNAAWVRACRARWKSADGLLLSGSQPVTPTR